MKKLVFEQSKSLEQAGLVVGFTAAYFIFTTVLFYIFSFAHKSEPVSYFFVLKITAAIAAVGLLLKWWSQ